MENWGELVSSNVLSVSAADIKHILECASQHACLEKEQKASFDTEDEKRRKLVLCPPLASNRSPTELLLEIHDVQPYGHMLEINEYLGKMSGLMEKLNKRKQSEAFSPGGLTSSFSSPSFYHRQRQTLLIDEPPVANNSNEKNPKKVIPKEVLDSQICYEILKRSVSTLLCCHGFTDCTTDVLALLVDLLHNWISSVSRDIALLVSGSSSKTVNLLAITDCLGGLPALATFYTVHIPAMHNTLKELAVQSYKKAVVASETAVPYD